MVETGSRSSVGGQTYNTDARRRGSLELRRRPRRWRSTASAHHSAAGVRLPSRVRSGRLLVPPIGAARQERAKLDTDLFRGRPFDIPPPVIDLVDTQVV